MRWQTETQLYATMSGHGRRLLFLIAANQLGSFSVVALEMPEPSPEELAETRHDPRAGIQRVFDDHAHQVLPVMPTLREAKALCERYGRWWQGSRAVAFASCTCEDLDPSTRKGKRYRIGLTRPRGHGVPA